MMLNYPKSTYKAGLYRLERETECSVNDDKIHYSEKIVKLTAAQAKVMFELYDKLGFKRIELIQ